MITPHDINFQRRELGSVPASAPHTLCLYPLGKKSRQRVGVGGKDGAATVFSIGKGLERVIIFETPTQSKPVSCVTLYEDQLFFVYGSVLQAYSRKGKLFFSFDTNVTEVIHTIFVSTPFIITCGSFMVTGFREAKELGFYMAPDRINAMVTFISTSSLSKDERDFEDYRCVLGCNDRTIRILSNHKLLDEINCEAPITSLCLSDKSRKLYYGTGAGSLGCLDIKQSDSTLIRNFSYIPQERQATVTSLAVYDINLDGIEELLVGRQDGSIHIFYINNEEGINDNQPICIWSGNTDESVLYIAGGFITHSHRPDVLVHSFSGKITAFSLKEEERPQVEEINNIETEQDSTNLQIKEVYNEIEILKQEIITKTKELAESTGATKNNTPLLAISSTFTVKITLSHQKDSPGLLLMIETDTPMDCLALQSEIQLHFIETESSEVIIQDKIPKNNPLTKTLAIVRPIESRKYSCSLAFWIEEGYSGLIKVNILASPVPRTAQVKIIQLKPLQLYSRIGGIEEEKIETQPIVSKMEIEGNFTARDMHSWIIMLLPGTPELYQVKLSNLKYENIFLHSIIHIKYEDGNAKFISDSLTALTVAKRFLTTCASERSLEISFRVSIHDNAVKYNLQNIVPLIAVCNKNFKNIQLIEALREIQGNQQETDVDFLSEEHQKLLNRADEIINENSQASFMIEYLKKLLLSLYDSVSDFVPNVPNMNPSIKESLMSLSSQSDTSKMMAALESIFCIS